MPIQVDTAGLHPTTESCLEAFQWLHEEHDFHNILDMGCGGGILSVVAAGIWDTSVLAVDISEKAVADAQKTIADRELAQQVTVLRSDGFKDRRIREKAPYDLIIFNLLAEVLLSMATEVQSHLAPEGVVILSGMLAWKAPETIAAYNDLGFEVLQEFVNTPWHTYILCHNSVTKRIPA